MEFVPQVALTLQQALKSAVAACEKGRFAEAEALCAAIVKNVPDHFGAFYVMALAQSRRGDFAAALSACDRALVLRPDHADTLHLHGATLQELTRFPEALASYDRALEQRPDRSETHYNRACILGALKRYDDALSGFDRALELRPNHVAALNHRGNTLHALGRLEEALRSYDQALAIDPAHAGSLHNRGSALQALGRLREAFTSFEAALALDPSHPHALAGLADCALKLCDFSRRKEITRTLRQQTTSASGIVYPFVLLGYADDAALHLRAARRFIRDRIPVLPSPLWGGEVWRNEKIRLAYLSADFRSHPVAHLIAEIIELHDRSRFEVIGVSFGPDDGSDMRTRLASAFDRLYDVRVTADRDVAAMLNELHTDIVVDLTGYTSHCRPEILASRPAPIAVNYLGYPGTMGAGFVDYIIADPVVLPFDRQPFYDEKIVHLPECYQANDRKRATAAHAPSRDACELPADGIVFCCFNSPWKIAPEIFDVWMRLLQKVDASVLWLVHDSDGARRNLRREAVTRGIDPARLVFAPKLPADEHLARHVHADLFLDTLPYNAHSTASDALWCGVPVVTCRGEGFAARVAASLLEAVGLGELVTSSLDEYETLALRLARDEILRGNLRRRLVADRQAHPLFDSPRFTRNVEAAYQKMWERWQRREKPISFALENTQTPG
jgi:protein O-GlcNAc transferase